MSDDTTPTDRDEELYHMSETEQKETELVTGTIGGIIQKGTDKWQVSVVPDGSQYAKNLWTKDSELVAALAQKIGQSGAFACNVSHWTNNDGKPVRSLWIEGETPAGFDAPTTRQNATPSQPAPVQSVASPPGTPAVDWDAKERRDYRSRAWAQTLGAFQHTIKVDEKPEDVFARLQPFQRKVFQDVCQSFAFPGDESDIPF